MNHLILQHSDYKARYEERVKGNTVDSYFAAPDRVVNVISWLDWIVMEGKPFNTVQKERTRKYSKLKPISIKTFMKYMRVLTKSVEKAVAAELPDQFALVIDGWSLDGVLIHLTSAFLFLYSGQSTHYLGIFASYLLDVRPKLVLLAFTTLLDEIAFTAAVHKQVIVDTLTVFQKSLDNVVCIVSDNCNTMLSLADLCGVPLLGLFMSFLFISLFI